jgi:hypothetical protein
MRRCNEQKCGKRKQEMRLVRSAVAAVQERTAFQGDRMKVHIPEFGITALPQGIKKALSFSTGLGNGVAVRRGPNSAFCSRARKAALFSQGVYSCGTRPEKKGPLDAAIGHKALFG